MEERKHIFGADSEIIHESIRPEDIRANDHVRARIRRKSEGAEYEDIRVWRLSPLGVELLSNNESTIWKSGEALDLEITIDGRVTVFEGLIVAIVNEFDEALIIGVRFHQPDSELRTDGADRRQQRRWLCSDQFLPVCVCPSPVRFNHFIRFRMIDVSLTGARLATSLTNKFLIPGINLDLSASFPLTGNTRIPAQIKRVEIGSTSGREELIVGIEFPTLGKPARDIVAHYLIQFQGAESAEEMRLAGLEPKSVAAGVHFTFVRTEEEYQEALNLRLRAYSQAGKYQGEQDPSIFADRFDATSRIAIGRFRGKVVATARINFPGSHTPLEQEQHVEWPSHLPRRDEVIEVSRACTDPDFRHSDLLAGLFRFIAVTCVTIERPYTVTMASPSMTPFYEKIGLEEVGLSYDIPLIGGLHNVMIGHSIKAMTGSKVNPLYWNFIWRTASDHLIKSGVVRPNGVEKIIRRIYIAIGPIADLIFRLKSAPSKRK